MKSELIDGRWYHSIRQSSIKQATICLERARLDWAGALPKIETDAACVGTAVHEAIQNTLVELKDTGSTYDQETCVEMFHHAFSALCELPNFRWVKYTEPQARSFGERCTRVWYQEVLDSIRPQHCEYDFDVPLLSDEHREVRLTGTIDLVDERQGLLDWKTSGRGKYAEWEYRRWAIQPTAYTYAANELGLHPITDRFTYVVLHEKGHQQFSVERERGDWRWLKQQVRHLCELAESNLASWPLNDTHALCSDKWCPAWDLCKGKHKGEQ